MIYGYARVSTEGQSLAVQLAELKAAGASETFAEKASGARSTRAQLARALKCLAPGDTLIVTRLDRLARSTRDLLNTLDAIGERGAAFRSLRDPWANTSTAHGRLMLTVLGGLAEFERELILSRTAEGRQRAKARGVKLGRKFVLSADQRTWVAGERAKGESVRHLARIMGVSNATIGRIPAAELAADQLEAMRRELNGQ